MAQFQKNSKFGDLETDKADFIDFIIQPNKGIYALCPLFRRDPALFEEKYVLPITEIAIA
jgi:hypothetical protein